MINDLCSLICDNGHGSCSFARYAISASLLGFIVDEKHHLSFSFEYCFPVIIFITFSSH